MKPHLPVLLRRAVLASFSFALAYSMSPGSAATADLTLGSEDSLSIDYADADSIRDLENGALQLSGDTILVLSNCGSGDGKTYTLLTGVSGLLDAEGNPLTLTDENNAIAIYFDTTQPGTGFWADATMELSTGELRLIRYSEITKPDGYNTSVSVDESADMTSWQESADDILFQINSSQQQNTKLVMESPSSPISTTSSGSRHFTSESIEGLASLSFCNSTVQLFNVATEKNLGFSHLKELSFEGNESTENGSIIHTNNSCTITFNDIGTVLFKNNSITKAVARGGAISGEDDGSSSVKIINCGAVTFESNSALYTDNGLARGGAIAIRDTNNLCIEKNASITFSNNSARSDDSITYENGYAKGGAISIDDDASASISNNGGVLFQQNKIDATATETATAQGGAIETEISSNLEVNSNEHVTFTENRAYSSGNTPTALGGAICSKGGEPEFLTPSRISISSNGAVLFSGNLSESYSSGSEGEACGGAIYTYNSNLTLNDNGSVIFNGNSAYAHSGYSSGGAIYGSYSDLTLSGNDSVTFSGNSVMASVHHAFGGAVYVDDGSTITLSNNGSVTFRENTASGSTDIPTRGGAIYVDNGSTFALSNNDSVTFSGNTATGSYAYGGAIHVDDGSTIMLSNNGRVTFSGNTASISGGAIYGDSDSPIMLSNNGSVTFSENTLSAPPSSLSTSGAAIYSANNLSICNNGSVLFEKNVEEKSGVYRLRSIYAEGSGDVISLSTAEGKSIEFRDSVYIGSGSTVALNADYTDAAGVVHEQTGDILFTGKYAEQHLNELLVADDAGRTATAEEILNSRTTEVNAMTNLHGGRLRVEDGAIYQGQGITAHEGSGATVRVKDAELIHVGYALEFNDGTALEVAGTSTIRGSVNLMEGSLFKLEKAASLTLHETSEADAATLTVNGGALLGGGATLNASLTMADGATLDMDALDAGAVTLNGALTFGGQVTMGDNLLSILSEMSNWEESVTLFTGLTDLVLPAVAVDETADRLWVGDVFSNLAGNEQYYFNYVADVGSLSIVYIPEPTTATLSLLALAGLAARRRRK